MSSLSIRRCYSAPGRDRPGARAGPVAVSGDGAHAEEGGRRDRESPRRGARARGRQAVASRGERQEDAHRRRCARLLCRRAAAVRRRGTVRRAPLRGHAGRRSAPSECSALAAGDADPESARRTAARRPSFGSPPMIEDAADEAADLERGHRVGKGIDRGWSERLPRAFDCHLQLHLRHGAGSSQNRACGSPAGRSRFGAATGGITDRCQILDGVSAQAPPSSAGFGRCGLVL